MTTEITRRRFLLLVGAGGLAAGARFVATPGAAQAASAAGDATAAVPAFAVDATTWNGRPVSLHARPDGGLSVWSAATGPLAVTAPDRFTARSLGVIGGALAIGGDVRTTVAVERVSGEGYRELLAAAGPDAELLLAQPGLDELEAMAMDVEITHLQAAVLHTADLADWQLATFDLGDFTGGSISALLGDGTAIVERYVDPHAPAGLDALLTGTLDLAAGTTSLVQWHGPAHGGVSRLGSGGGRSLLAIGEGAGTQLVEAPTGAAVGSLPRGHVPVGASLDTGGTWRVFAVDPDDNLFAYAAAGGDLTGHRLSLAPESLALIGVDAGTVLGRSATDLVAEIRA